MLTFEGAEYTLVAGKSSASPSAHPLKNSMTTNSRAERRLAGKSLRQMVTRESQAVWDAQAYRRDALENLTLSNQGRVPELIPIRYGRMLRDPFAFLRGSPGLMAQDLAHTPVTGVRVQACGDAHLLNFGFFATPERNLNFDINDFDETLPAPWEWDVKRLVTSFVVAARVNGIGDGRAQEIAVACSRSYRQHLREFAEMNPLEIWYYRIGAEHLAVIASEPKAKKRLEKFAEKAQSRLGENLVPKITEAVSGQHRFIEQPPVMTRVTDQASLDLVHEGLEHYRASLPEDRRVLFDRYRVEDFAFRVVGVGSVGTRCFVGLFFCDDENPLLLQVKEARPSVLAPYAGTSSFDNQGQRVVVGQRIIQAASDIFLGWARTRKSNDFYVRQLRDMKFSAPIDEFSAGRLENYAEVCGWTLARAHATSGDPANISGYLGRGDRMDLALAGFALKYADQVEQDHAAFAAAAHAGRVEVAVETNR